MADNDPTASVTASLRDLFVVMDVANQPATPLAFLTVLRRAYPQFAQQDHGHYMQQDAEECWTQMMTALSQKLPRLPGIVVCSDHRLIVADAPENPATSSSSAKPSVVSDLFHGMKVTT